MPLLSQPLNWLLPLLFLALMGATGVARADEFRPAMLDVVEQENGWVDVTWKLPLVKGKPVPVTPVLPEFFQPMGSGTSRQTAGSRIDYASFRTDGRSLTVTTIVLEGLAAVPMDVLVRVALNDGTEHSAMLRSGKVAFTIPERPTRGELAVSYWQIGTIHILEGFDHLLFLLTLLLIVNGMWPLLKTVTAFTLAHSLTLATLDLVRIPSDSTEAVISLSIVLLAVEVVRKNQGELTLSERFLWLVAFTFGLVHGLGFAGALSEIVDKQIVKPGGYYSLTDSLKLGVGYKYVKKKDSKDEQDSRQELYYNPGAISAWDFGQQFRWEQRTGGGLDGVVHRLRYLLHVSHPLGNTGKYYFAAQQAVRFNTASNDTGHVDGFEQNRLYIGVGRKMTKKLKVEVGHLWNHQREREGPNLSNHLLRLQFLIDTKGLHPWFAGT